MCNLRIFLWRSHHFVAEDLTEMRTVKDIMIYANGRKRTIVALFDTGATVNYIKKEIGEKFDTRMKLPESISVGLGGKKQKIEELISVSVLIDRFKMPSQNFYLADIRKFDAILGAFFLEQWGIVLDPKSKKLKIKKEWIQLQEEY